MKHCAVPAASQLPEHEIAICRRVRQVREDLKWSQPNFAKELGVSRVRLASYEYARAPIRYDFGSKLCRAFNINQRWLAFGKFPKKPYMETNAHLESQLKGRELFSEAIEMDVLAKVPVERSVKVGSAKKGEPFVLTSTPGMMMKGPTLEQTKRTLREMRTEFGDVAHLEGEWIVITKEFCALLEFADEDGAKKAGEPSKKRSHRPKPK